MMIKTFKYTICALLCVCLLLPLIPRYTASAYTYTDGYTTVGDVTIPFAEYMPGSFFTKNGKACACHSNSAINCVASGDNCNCLRYVTVDGKEIDLLAVQCIGFARYCFYRLFGFVDNDYNTSLYYNAGTLSAGNVTASTVKALVQKLKPGAHIRYQLAYTQHSVILLNQNENGFTVYQANAGGNGIDSEPCVVSTRTYTWEQFASTAYRGVLFAHLPNSYPTNLSYSATRPSKLPSVPTVETAVGVYLTAANVNLRSGADTSYASLGVVPNGTQLTVTKTENGWGQVDYNGTTGWISLDYATLVHHLVLKSNSLLYVDGSYLLGIQCGALVSDTLVEFVTENAAAESGTDVAVATGSKFGVVDDGGFIAELTAVVIGDVNGDGIINTADFMSMKAHLNGSEDLNGAFLLAADVNGDGYVSVSDYKKLKYIVYR